VHVKTFGSPVPGVGHAARHAAYAVVHGRRGLVAAVRTSLGYFLPGGGALDGETLEETVMREVREELAREVRMTGEVVEAVQYFAVDGHHFRMEAAFLGAEFAGGRSGCSEHRLVWVRADHARRFFHASHVWAATHIE
jgi:8-oxo-dGTP pyrophosphatase MutT (NUDIX family)